MVLTINRCIEFQTLKVAVTLTLTLVAKKGGVLRGVVLHL